ncbi:MAG: hypothetical protein AMXMBFR84_11000 [Candidatus Hydrogenedentota bacterium]
MTSAPEVKSRMHRAGQVVLALAALGILAFTLQRFYLAGASFGEPFLLHPDEDMTAGVALEMVRKGEFNPKFFGYPSLYLYVLGANHAVSHLRFLTSGEYRKDYSDPQGKPASRTWPDINEHDQFLFYREARKLNALFIAAMAFFVFLTGRELFNAWFGLVAAAWSLYFPNLVEEGHYAVPQAIIVCIVSASVYVAVLYVRTGKLSHLYLGAIVAGLAFGTKYNYVPLAVTVAALLVRGPIVRWKHLPLLVLTFLGTFVVTTPFSVIDLPKFLETFGAEIFVHKWGSPFMTHEGRPLLWYWKTWASHGAVYFYTAWIGLLITPFLVGRKGIVFAVFPLLFILAMAEVKLLFERNSLPLVPFFGLGFAGACFALFVSSRWIAERVIKHNRVAMAAGALAPALLLVLAMPEPVKQSQEIVKRLRTRATFTEANTWIWKTLPAKSRIVCDNTWLPAVVPLGLDKYTVTKGPLFLFAKPYIAYLDQDYAVSAYGAVYDNLGAIRQYNLNVLAQTTSRISTKPIEDYLARNRDLIYNRFRMLKNVQHLPPEQNNRISVFNFDIEVFEVPEFTLHTYEAETFMPDAAIAQRMQADGVVPKDAFPLEWNGSIGQTVELPRGVYDVFMRASCDVGNRDASQTVLFRIGADHYEAEVFSYESLDYYIGTLPLVAGGPVSIAIEKVDPMPVYVDKVIFVQTGLDPEKTAAEATDKSRFSSANLMKNGGFEYGDSPYIGWNYKPTGGVALHRDKVERAGGDASLYVELTPDVNLGISQNILDVKAGTRYLLRGKIKVEALKHYACLEVQDMNTGFKTFNAQTKRISGTTPWVQVEVEFTVPEGTKNLSIFLRRPCVAPGEKGDGRIWFDDVEMYALKPQP